MDITSNQIIAIVVVLAVILVSLKIIKGILKWVVTIGAICIGLVYFGLATPQQIQDVSKQIANKGIETYEKVADASENIRIKDNKLEIKIDSKKWVDISKLKSVVKETDKGLVVNIDGKKYTITDKEVKRLIKSFQKK